MSDLLTRYSEMIDMALEKALPECSASYKSVIESMRYSLFAGGKRIRPALVLEFCRLCDGEPEKALPFACAIEMIHTYSLIHDDLPCMDDDDYRRGKLSNHKAFGEDVALLAGDALQSEAFRCLCSADLPNERIRDGVAILSDHCGTYGMVAGQMLDIRASQTPLSSDDILEMYSLKTSGLLIAACQLGCVAAGRPDLCDSAAKFGNALGLAFQIQDDILDIVGDFALLGKTIGSDEKNKKPTLVVEIGLQQAKRLVERYSDDAILALSIFGESAQDLIELTQTLKKRVS